MDQNLNNKKYFVGKNPINYFFYFIFCTGWCHGVASKLLLFAEYILIGNYVFMNKNLHEYCE